MFVCCGEALIDMLPRQMADGSDVFLPVPGGAVFNTAIALGRLGEKVAMVTGLSTDMFGDQLAEALEHSRVDATTCVRINQPSTLAFVKLTNGHAQYSFFDENSAGRMLSTENLPKLPNDVKALHFGAISLIPEPCGSAYEALMARNQDKVLSLDPNIRPGFIEDAARHRSRIARMAAMADIIKVSDEDLDWLSEGKDGTSLIETWLSGATSIVLITRGADGVNAYTRTGELFHPAEKVEVVDTVGAGDTFNAGFLAGLRRADILTKQSLSEADGSALAPALALASQVAARVVAVAGANPPWFD